MAANYTQKGRRLQVETPLGADALLLTEFQGQEGMNRLFRFDLAMLSERDSIAPQDIVGKNVTFTVLRQDNQPRYFNGFVSRFAYCGRNDRFSMYRAEVVPWLWFLARTADCRIFQDMSVPDIIKKVFAANGFTDYEVAGIHETHPPWTYCVQYRETAFQFVSRLMEQEGIFYYFRHENGKHVLVLGDTKQAYRDCEDGEVNMSPSLSLRKPTDLILRWEHAYEYRSGRWTCKDYNFETPAADLLADATTVVKLANNAQFELFDYPGLYDQVSKGKTLARMRMEEEEAAYNVVTGESCCRAFSPGAKFLMKKNPCPPEANQSYALTTVEHRAVLAGSYITGPQGETFDYQNRFTCIPSSSVFRPPRTTAKPRVHGAQTAFVVGPGGQEIYTDSYGRIKVQFHWDRLGVMDEKSSCWMRVAQPLAGKQWGAMFLPRIGQEVLIHFLEGDPDQPICMGTVYNAAGMPPYTLPDNKTMSTIKSCSTPGAGGFNEIRIEDKKGDEKVFIHAEKDQDIRVKNDCAEWIGRNRHLMVIQDQIEEVQNNRHENVTNDHMEEIGKDRHLKVAGKEAVEIGQSRSLTVTGDVIEVFKANHSEQVTSDYYLKGDNIVIEGMTNVTIKVGQTYIAIESSGIKIGTTGTIELESTGKTSIKATGGLSEKGPTVEVSGDAMTTIKGGLVKIN